MAFVINIITMIGTALWWVIQKFFPYIIKKFGILSVKAAIQKTISALVILITVAFFGAVLFFISQTYTIFRQFVAVLNNPASTGLGGGAGSEYLSCFMNLLHASGIADGFNAAFSFGISVLIFFFLRGLYSIALKTTKIISDEVAKSLKLV
jgi:hypothetical protein